MPRTSRLPGSWFALPAAQRIRLTARSWATGRLLVGGDRDVLVSWAAAKYLGLRVRYAVGMALVTLGLLAVLASTQSSRDVEAGWPLLAAGSIGLVGLVWATLDHRAATGILRAVPGTELDACGDIAAGLRERGRSWRPASAREVLVALGAGLIVTAQAYAAVWLTFYYYVGESGVVYALVGTALTLPLLIPLLTGARPLSRKRAATVGGIWLLVGLFPLWIFLAIGGPAVAAPAGLLALVGAATGRS